MGIFGRDLNWLRKNRPIFFREHYLKELPDIADDLRGGRP